jgi:hypothetical protein
VPADLHEQLLLPQEGAVVIDPAEEAPRSGVGSPTTWPAFVKVVAGTAPVPGAPPGDRTDAPLVVRVAPYTAGGGAAREAQVGIAIADPALAQAITAAVTAAVTAAICDAGPDRAPADRAPTVRLRSRKRLARLAGRLTGAIAIVPVTARNARHLVALVDGIRAAGAAGVQLVWDGTQPPRAAVERHVFAVLERARATPNDPPVVLATSDPPAAALHLLIAHRSPSTPSTRRDEPR